MVLPLSERIFQWIAANCDPTQFPGWGRIDWVALQDIAYAVKKLEESQ